MGKRDWVEHNACRFCKGSHMHSCGPISCFSAIQVAEEYYDEHKEEFQVIEKVTKSKKVRSMSDEDLAKFLADDCSVCLNIVGDYECNHNCVEHWKKWLASDVYEFDPDMPYA
ncbi:MAG: hypothetical protein LUG90_21455 [Clostridiaceae bacterium]|nr:hypothetical protein [Clostridiaceae bacterium]